MLTTMVDFQTTNTYRFLLAMAGIFAIYFLKLYESGLLTSLLVERTVVPFRNYYDLVGTACPKQGQQYISGGHCNLGVRK